MLTRAVIWGVLVMVLLMKEMAVSDGWDGRSWDFRGGLLISSSFRAGLRRSRLRMLLVLSDVGAVVEELSLLWWFDVAAWLRVGDWTGAGGDAVSPLFTRSMTSGVLLVLEACMGTSSSLSLSMSLLLLVGGLLLLKGWGEGACGVDVAAG